MVEKGVVFGRFQVLHNKHMEYVLAAKMRCKKLYIGITHSDITMFGATSEFDVNGSAKICNPMTYLERMEMIQKAVEGFGIKKENYEIVPFPITHPELIAQYAPKDATYYVNVHSEWDEEKRQTLEKLGMKVEVLMQKAPEDVGIRGEDVRRMMAEEENKEWRQHVPKAVYEYIVENKIDKRIRRLNYKYMLTEAEVVKEGEA